MGPRLDAVATILAAVALSQRWRSGSEHAQTLATVFESRASALAHAPRFYDRATADIRVYHSGSRPHWPRLR